MARRPIVIPGLTCSLVQSVVKMFLGLRGGRRTSCYLVKGRSRLAGTTDDVDSVTQMSRGTFQLGTLPPTNFRNKPNPLRYLFQTTPYIVRRS